MGRLARVVTASPHLKGTPWDEGFCHTHTPPSIFQTGSVFSRVKEWKMKMLLLDDHPWCVVRWNP